MARSIWSGAVSFGLVTVPVKLYTATDPQDIRFRQFQEGTGQRIRYQRVAEESGEEVDYADIVKGYEVEKGRFVIVTPEELASVEPTRSRTIDIEDFVDLDDIDPVYFEKTYYLAPANETAHKPYALLHRTMRDTNKVAVARFVMRTKQYLAALRPVGELLALETMFFADEVRGADSVDDLPGDVDLSDRELGIAEQLVESMASEWDPTRYKDTYRERVLELIERKAEGEEVVVEAEAETPQVVDLMAALRASVDQAKQRGGPRSAADRDVDPSEDAKGGDAKGGDAKGGRGGSTPAGLAELSKEELYERASEAGIAGRSKMTKDELVAALTKQAS